MIYRITKIIVKARISRKYEETEIIRLKVIRAHVTASQYRKATKLRSVW